MSQRRTRTDLVVIVPLVTALAVYPRASPNGVLPDDSLAAEIQRVRADDDFTARAKKLLERDREILDRLAK